MSEEDRRRTVAKLTRFIARAQREVASILAASRNAKKDKGKHLPLFEGMYTALEKYYSMYEGAFHELSIIASEDEGYDFPKDEDSATETTMRNSYYEIKASYISLTKPDNPPSTSRTSLNETATVVHESSHSHLPEIKLVPFDGEILNWPKFRDVFVSVVEESKLTPAKKFHYLITNLTGPALSLVNKFQITDQNYPLAWAALCETYDKQRLLATAYLNRVINFPQIRGKPSIDMLKSFMTTVCDSILSFELLAITNESKFILFHLSFRLLDPVTREQFQNAHKETEFPTFEQLLKFIRDRCFSMQLTSETNSTFDNSPSTSRQISSDFPKNRGTNNKTSFRSSGKASLVVNHPNNKQQSTPREFTFSTPCIICNEGSHGLLSCRKFCSADVNQRITWLAKWDGCKNCLSGKHPTVSCSSKWVCRWCKQRHNSMLCVNEAKNKITTGHSSENSRSGAYCASPGSYAVTHYDSHSHVILGTLMAEVLDTRNEYQTVRIVVDSASHYSFMTYKCANRLGLTHNKCDVKISGIGQSQEGARSFVNCGIKPVSKSAPILSMKALLLKSITSFLPAVSLPRKELSSLWMKCCKFPLADPTFFESRPIDILLGADLFSEIWIGSPIELDSNLPKLFPTIFGHVVIGKFTSGSTESQTPNATSLIATNPISIDNINLNLSRFWEIEELKPVKAIDPEEAYCEDHFKATHYRLEGGSYGVRLPFRSSPPEFTNISTISKRRFRNQENRLLKNDNLREKYHDFMKEYEQLGHMTVSENPPAYVIPHHAVWKIDRHQPKLRVVFDGSAQSLNGSLNDYLMVGPKLQTDIRDVLLNFRAHKYALVADIVKCFRGIWVHPDDRKYQTIFWRYNPYDALQVYELNTVVYGLSSSPYHANRVVQAIVEDHGSAYPEASKVLKRSIYVDDIVSGCDTIEGAAKLQSQLIELLGKGQFKLSKWASNCPEILKNVSETSDQPVTIISKDDTSVKILGLQWNPTTDCFSYNLQLPNVEPTKRSILSNVSKIYDPLGFISPLVITMKQFLQECWKLGVEWDESVPTELGKRWEAALKQLPIISNLCIPRFVRSEYPAAYQVVGFADASETAYCAALYLRVLISPKEIKTSLLTAKTKLAPLKSLTIPRLELCGCFLLARLYQSIAEFMELLQPTNLIAPYFFSDSTVALGWIHTPTYKLKTFVCNRISEILQITSADQWHHVPSGDNPADLGSRGIFPDKLLKNSLWWKGPTWLAQPESSWNLQSPLIQPDASEMKREKVALISCESPADIQSKFIVEFTLKFSSFNRLLRTLAHVLRFVKNLRDNKKRSSGPLTVSEIRSAQTLCVKAVQAHFIFKNDFSEKGQMKVMKKFVKLNPFFDVEGILRAGGRLYNASLPYNHKHPVLIPPESHLSILIVDHFHRTYLHPGPSLLHAVVQMEFWIPSLRRLAQQRVFQCKRCYRLKAKSYIPKMADLPSYRVQATRAFLRTGLDFCGPFWMKDSHRRKPQLSKVYLCIFICMATKAIHIEGVTSLSADAFLAALDRFVSLRGLPTDCYSDCGSNFISAARQLKEWYEWFASEHAQYQIAQQATVRHINWHFNPPHAPHFGGIWEAGVKSAKSLMIRQIGNTILTYEELATLVAKISAVLNSRPICPLSPDPSESEYLSPGHFLIGEAPLAIPEPTLLDVTMNRLDRWQLVKRMSQSFWERWHKEYLLTLQKRNKWTQDAPNLKVGDLVFLKDNNQPILQWSRARIIQLHPGDDGKVRVATVKTPTSTFTRPVAKLIPLFPLEEDTEESTLSDPPEGEKKRYQKWIRGTNPAEEEEEPSTLDSAATNN